MQLSEITAGSTKNIRLLGAVLAFILAGIPFFLGKYVELSWPGPFDSAAYVYSAEHILAGAQLGVEEKPSAQLGTLVVNLLGVQLFGFRDLGPKLIQGLLQTVALFLMFIAMRRLYGGLAAVVAVVVASVYLSSPLIAKFGNVKEQYMIAFAVMGISCFVLQRLNKKPWLTLLAGVCLAYSPLFKQTGIAAPAALTIFLILQPLFGLQSWRQTRLELSLLVLGAAIGLAPLCLWLIDQHAPVMYWPYFFAWGSLVFKTVSGGASYVSGSRTVLAFSEQWPRVLRYYGLVGLPILLGVISIFAYLMRIMLHSLGRLTARPANFPDQFVILLAIWWLLDMAFVWISPRSYEQYYLPLCASAAMLGGYATFLFADAYHNSNRGLEWIFGGGAALAFMAALSWHVFAGVIQDPGTGAWYAARVNGYLQRTQETVLRRRHDYKNDWELAGAYIYKHSKPTDQIYVWGWVPGIYVAAQRMSPAARAFEANMHVKTPGALSALMQELLGAFSRKLPKFIVDTHKNHFPWDRPPLELWPTTRNGPLANTHNAINRYELQYGRMLRNTIDANEAARFRAMKPFRQFVMKNYVIDTTYGPYTIFRHMDMSN